MIRLPFVFPVVVIGITLNAGVVLSEEPGRTILFPQADAKDRGLVDWAQVIRERLPELKNNRGDRWPLVLWENPPPDRLDENLVKLMLARGIAPVLAMHSESIVAARLVQGAGAPVILRDTRGTGDPWPYDLAGHPANWSHRYGAGEQVPDAWRKKPSPTVTTGWSLAARQLREMMAAFRSAGVRVDAVWLDYESEPLGADYEAARASAATRGLLPDYALSDAAAFRLYTRRLWMQLLSSYIAAPIREVYPAVSITNWIATVSLPEMPVQSWDNLPHPAMGATLFTATNPVAYGIDTAYFFNAEKVLNQRAVDRVYMHILLRQVSADGYARDRIAPELESIPWVARWVVDHPDRRTPEMSRPAYREALRHLWLRGVDGMQVFNPVRKGYSEQAVIEVEDAVAVYDEMLTWREFLDGGTVMNYRVPEPDGKEPLWSGLRLDNRALVHVTSLDGGVASLTVEPWPGANVELLATTEGTGYILKLDESDGKVHLHQLLPMN